MRWPPQNRTRRAHRSGLGPTARPPASRRAGRRRPLGLRAGALAVLAVLAVGCSSAPQAVRRSGVPTPTTAPPRTPAVAAWTEVATLDGAVEVHVSPDASSPATLLPATWHGATLTLPVLDSVVGWLDVRLPGRPNGQTGWVASDQVSLARTPYHLVVDLATEHLELYDMGRLVLDAPAGIGTAQYPTPVGHFFVALLAQSPGPEWGPFVMVTSAHSDTITDWEESGDALVAIHGPLGDDAQIGTTGAAVSHGCIRLHVSDLEQLRPVPVGTPVDVIAGQPPAV